MNLFKFINYNWIQLLLENAAIIRIKKILENSLLNVNEFFCIKQKHKWI